MNLDAHDQRRRLTLRYSAKVALGCAILCIIAGAIWPADYGGCARDILTGEWMSSKSYGTLILWCSAAGLIIVAACGIRRTRE